MFGKVKSFKNFSFQILKALFALAIAILISQFQFDYLDSIGYDLFLRLKPQNQTTGHVETILVTKESLEILGGQPTAGNYADLIKLISEANPRAIVTLIHPNEMGGSFDELKRLIEAVNSASEFYVAVDDISLLGFNKEYKLPPPFQEIPAIPGLALADRNIFAKDGVTRRFTVSYQGNLTLHPILAQNFRSQIQSEQDVAGSYPFRDSFQAFIDFKRPGTYKQIPFHELLFGDFDTSKLRDKIVLIGRDTKTSSKDYIKTPFSDDLIDMTTTEMHANIIDTVIMNSAPVRIPKWFEFLLTGLISLLTVYVVLSLPPTKGIVFLLLFGMGFVALNFASFLTSNSWVAMTHSFLAIFICYYFFIPYRLIIENRKSWEYYQKNRLLTQVEELKSSFLSMMSHDLKTPIARIQGMIEIIKKRSQDLDDQQKAALDTINESARELLEFVSSILSLNRVESKEIKLQLESRDINELLKEVKLKYEHFAGSKKIEIVTELEPLFSHKIDVDLLKQVFSNLLENAIKYSPEGSRVLISSEDTGDEIVIQFADQGVGIASAERAEVFTKFFRSSQAKDSEVKGSGLGLYLAKYFVELHGGKISVDSELGQGSTFTVCLPTGSQSK